MIGIGNSAHPRIGRDQKDCAASPKSEFKRFCGEMGAVHQGGLPLEGDSVWGEFSSACYRRIRGALPSGAESPGQGQRIVFPID